MGRKLDISRYSPPTLLGKLLIKELEVRGGSMSDFLRRSGIDRTTYLRLITTPTRPDLDVLLQISKGLDLNLLILIMLSRPDDAALVAEQFSMPKNIQQELITIEELSPNIAALLKLVLHKKNNNRAVFRDVLQAIDADVSLLVEEESDKNEQEQALQHYKQTFYRLDRLISEEQR